MSGTWLCARAAATTATSTPSPCLVRQAELRRTANAHEHSFSQLLSHALCCLSPLHAAAAAKRAREVFEQVAARHGFNLQHLPKAAADAAREQLQAAGGPPPREPWLLKACLLLGVRILGCPPRAAAPFDCSARAAAVGDSGEYFVALLPDGSRLVHPIAYGERFPLNYGREVLAELAGVPDRWAAAAARQTAV